MNRQGGSASIFSVTQHLFVHILMVSVLAQRFCYLVPRGEGKDNG